MYTVKSRGKQTVITATFSEPEEAINALGELQKISRPVAISFQEMLGLMDKCQLLDMIRAGKKQAAAVNGTHNPEEPKSVLFNSPFSLFSGIIPGTCATHH